MVVRDNYFVGTNEKMSNYNIMNATAHVWSTVNQPESRVLCLLLSVSILERWCVCLDRGGNQCELSANCQRSRSSSNENANPTNFLSTTTTMTLVDTVLR